MTQPRHVFKEGDRVRWMALDGSQRIGRVLHAIYTGAPNLQDLRVHEDGGGTGWVLSDRVELIQSDARHQFRAGDRVRWRTPRGELRTGKVQAVEPLHSGLQSLRIRDDRGGHSWTYNAFVELIDDEAAASAMGRAREQEAAPEAQPERGGGAGEPTAEADAEAPTRDTPYVSGWKWDFIPSVYENCRAVEVSIYVPCDQTHDFIERLKEWAETPTNTEAPTTVLLQRMVEKIMVAERHAKRAADQLECLEDLRSEVEMLADLMEERLD